MAPNPLNSEGLVTSMAPELTLVKSVGPPPVSLVQVRAAPDYTSGFTSEIRAARTYTSETGGGPTDVSSVIRAAPDYTSEFTSEIGAARTYTSETGGGPTDFTSVSAGGPRLH